MSVVSASGPSKFLDARDFILDGKVVQEYPYRLEPVRGLGGLKDGPLMEDDCLRCTFCRKKYRGKNSKSMWRRHVQKSHKIKLKNFRERNSQSRFSPSAHCPNIHHFPAEEHEAFQQSKRSELREKRQQSQQANEHESSLPMPLPYPPPPAYPISRMPLAETAVSHNLVIIPHFKTPSVNPGVFEESTYVPTPAPAPIKKRPKASSKNAKENALGSKSKAKRTAPTASTSDVEVIQHTTIALNVTHVSVQDSSQTQSPTTCAGGWSPSTTALKRSSSAQALTLLSPIESFVPCEGLEHVARETMPFFAPPLAPASLLASPSDVHRISYMHSSSIDDDLSGVAQSTSQLSIPYSSGDDSGDEWFVEYELSPDGTVASEPDTSTSTTLPPTTGLGFDMSAFFGSSSSMDVLEEYSHSTDSTADIDAEIDVDQWLAFDSDDEDDAMSPTISATS